MRPVTPSDAAELADLESILFDNALGEKILEGEIARGKGWVLGDPIQGYILTVVDRDLVDITRLGIHPEAQGKGLGGLLLAKVLEEAPKVVLTVKKDNIRALRLYHKHGFEVVGHLSGAAAWIMLRVPLQEAL
jgi:ribosomal protein S18 acetylase RimI-like enzyme